MSAFFNAILSFLVTLVKTPLTYLIGFWAGKSAGKKDAYTEHLEKDFDAVERAERARRNVKHDADSVRRDPYNRDTDA